MHINGQQTVNYPQGVSSIEYVAENSNGQKSDLPFQ